MSKKETYICNECRNTTCMTEKPYGHIPDGCTYKNTDGFQKWQKTTACEITKPVHDPEKCKTCDHKINHRPVYTKEVIECCATDLNGPIDCKKAFETSDCFYFGKSRIEPNFKTDFKNISVPWKGKNKLSPALAKLARNFPATPNCAICQWKDICSDKQSVFCSAQGYKLTKHKYNSPECKRLFKEKPGTEPDQE